MYPGVDIIEISRFTKACSRQPRLLARLFTERELEYLKTKSLSSFAARFAGKEAVLKVLGTGLRGLSWHDIEIFNNDLGQPMVHLSDHAKKILEFKGGEGINISLSHSRDNAIAMAIMQLKNVP